MARPKEMAKDANGKTTTWARVVEKWLLENPQFDNFSCEEIARRVGAKATTTSNALFWMATHGQLARRREGNKYIYYRAGGTLPPWKIVASAPHGKREQWCVSTFRDVETDPRAIEQLYRAAAPEATGQQAAVRIIDNAITTTSNLLAQLLEARRRIA